MLATLSEPPLTVSEAVHYLKKVLEQDELLRSIWVQGEISDYKVHLASGHCYFTLKDETAQLLCVFFKHARQRAGLPELRNGMAVLAAGYVSFYEHTVGCSSMSSMSSRWERGHFIDALSSSRSGWPLRVSLLRPASA